ncbi:MAG: Brp/Blh family beta-carotene 15,15'-monooxygenase [Arcticibacterium sp.]|jgi:Brp/Blh family beta-carotene 15,15'-monooxygenase
MSRIYYIFLILLLVITVLFETIGVIHLDLQIYICGIFISLLGIPHGAIDHIIYRQDKNISSTVFYSFYLGLMVLYCILWVYFPAISMTVFVLISAFHFGQSQFSKLLFNEKSKIVVLQITWGLSILSGLVIYNFNQISVLASSNSDTMALLGAFNYTVYLSVLIISTFIAVSLLCNLLTNNSITLQYFIKETAILGLIHLCFFHLPILVGFTLYFCTLHSMQVLTEEFEYLKKRMHQMSAYKFLKLLTPFTLLSLIGSGILLFLSQSEILNISSTLLLFILISILTLPHSIVMDNFYFKSSKLQP